MSRPLRRLELTNAAKRDIERLNAENPNLARRVIALLLALRDGEINGEPLAEMAATTGDLSGCYKLYFGADARQDTHRIVYRETADGDVEVIEVVVVEARDELYAYLLAAQRLGRLPEESRSRLTRLHQRIIAGRTRRGRQP